MRVGNEEIADLLERVADLLEAQHADGYRVRAYRNASQTCRTLERPLWEISEQGGRKALVALPTIGKSLAAAIEEYLHTGRLGLLDRLEGQVSPEDLFTTLPGVGDELAHRIHDELHVETLEELEEAAHDGRLAGVTGIGVRRAHAIRDELAAVLSRSVRRRARRIRARERAEEADHPSVAAILEVDAEYRDKAAAGKLRRIAPRRFNPSGEAWLPVLHAAHEGWQFTALFSNTARAHRLNMTHDWVVVIYERDGHEGQCTVVTEHRGPRAGTRVVRGRESECPLPANAG
jgi:DNA polymerase/3'-5' exonuclease PolX